MALVKDSMLLANKFRGCLLGALLGDCLGSPFEGEDVVSKVVLQKYLDKLEGPYFASPLKMYTDDTAMTKCVAESLIAKCGMDQKDLAQRFVKEFYKEPRRGYGQNVVDVFEKLRCQKFENVLRPAEEQFGGRGSYGNGGAMRISPVALFCMNSYEDMLHVAKQNALITHANVLGFNGAILQCIAIYMALQMDSKTPLDIQQFSSQLKEKMKVVEKKSMEKEVLDESDKIVLPYTEKLSAMEKLLERTENGLKVPDEEVDTVLGTGVAALHSVPTAVYCFLRAQKEIPDIQTDNPFRRTIQYAISLGGDTDTIASMAGAIAGSYYGYDFISENIKKHCESVDNVIDLADKLYDIVSSNISADTE